MCFREKVNHGESCNKKPPLPTTYINAYVHPEGIVETHDGLCAASKESGVSVGWGDRVN